MLASEQQALLLQELLRRVPSSDAWLACYYRCKLDQSFALELSDTVGAVGASGGGVAVTVARQPHPYAAHVHPSSTEGAAPALGVGGGVGGGSAAPDPAPRARPSASAQRTHTETFGLEHNSDVLSSIAESHYDVGDYVAAYAISSRVLQADPYELACVPVHCCTLLQLRRKPELFALAHKLVEGYPQRAESWFGARGRARAWPRGPRCGGARRRAAPPHARSAAPTRGAALSARRARARAQPWACTTT